MENNAKPKGKIFKPDQVQWAPLPRLDTFKHIIGHWDIAYSDSEEADFNAVRVWGVKAEDFFYINSYVKQSKMKAAVLWMCMFQKQLPPTVKIHWQFESQFWNGEVERTIEDVQKATGIKLGIVKINTPRIKKYDRIYGTQTYYQNGRLYYNQKLKSHADTQQGLAQLYGIEPNYTGKDDAPDADEQCFQQLEKYVPSGSTGTGNDYQAGRMEPNNERI